MWLARRSTRLLLQQLEASRLPAAASSYRAHELTDLPVPVQRYFRAVLADGQPIITAVTVAHTGMFNVSTSGERWVAFTSQQRVVTRRPGFVWNARMALAPGLAIRVVDAYVQGEGALKVTVLGLFNIADQHGAGDIAKGELMRFLAEAAWYPTALLPSQGVRWEAVDDHAANASLVDGQSSVTLQFHFDAAGLIDSIRADARGASVGKTIVMTPWECRLWSYRECDGVRVPLAGEAAWLWPQGRRAYWQGTVTALKCEVAR